MQTMAVAKTAGKGEQNMAQTYAERRRPAFRAAFRNTGIPKVMQERFETASGLSFDDVHINYNSPRPAKLGALAYTQGTQVYIGPGQEQHLEHELGHVLQQKRGLVKADGYLDGLPVNRNSALERAADLGADQPVQAFGGWLGAAPIQMVGGEEEEEEVQEVGVEEFGFNIRNIPNMTRDEIIQGRLDGWTYTDRNGFVHIRDTENRIRIRIDPPDRTTDYHHVHLYDRAGNPLDINGNVVGRTNEAAHLHYRVEQHDQGGHNQEEQHGPAEEE